LKVIDRSQISSPRKWLPLHRAIIILLLGALLPFACQQPYDPANPGGMPPEHPVPARAIVTKPAMPEDIS